MTSTPLSPPSGYIEVTIMYLEMWTRPGLPPVAPPRPEVTVMRAQRPSLSFYRYLYNQVGGPWLWYERRLMGDDRLRVIVHDPAVEVHVLYAAGVPAGYAELDCRAVGEIELAYFGLVPEFIGQGLGSYFLAWAINRAWDLQPRRLWVHTCSLDHVRAQGTYKSAGFSEYARETVHIADPRSLLKTRG
ncbi:MAG TPA: GNAT family N-acetyltransferase [Kofleriaceae bacterium]|nr:GNAT family N-acetyltransferase [Kofleriaceae bacterium]